jgi:hypothetical protein
MTRNEAEKAPFMGEQRKDVLELFDRLEAAEAREAKLREALKAFDLRHRTTDYWYRSAPPRPEQAALEAAIADAPPHAALDEAIAAAKSEGFMDGRAGAWGQAAEKVNGTRECGPGSILFTPLECLRTRVAAEARRKALEDAAEYIKHASHEDGPGMGSQRMEREVRDLAGKVEP